MKVKQLYGIVGIVIGVALIGFSLYAKSRVSHARENADQVSSFFSKNPVSSAVEHGMEGKLSAYDMMILWTMIGGIVIGAAGVYIVVRSKKR